MHPSHGTGTSATVAAGANPRTVPLTSPVGERELGHLRPERFVVRPSGPLHGVVRAGGAKNSSLKLMAASLLAEGRHVLSNVPRITDVEIMADVLRAVGCSVERRADGRVVVETPPADALVPVAPFELVDKMRASIVVLGPLLARCGWARISTPGGDDFGGRPIDFHLEGLSSMGARFHLSGDGVDAVVETETPGRSHPRGSAGCGRLAGSHITLGYPSHTATDNLLMASVLAQGTTVIENAAREPEVCDLAEYLTKMGARISGAGTPRIEVEGVEALLPADHTVVFDRVVAATLMSAVAICGGEATIEDAREDAMAMLLRKLAAMGVSATSDGEGVTVAARGRLHAVDVATLPYPGVATDYEPFLVTLLSVADGVGIVSENLFSGRFRYVDELRRMGADVRVEGHHAVVRGVPELTGAPVRATDIRAGAALVVAGLVARGETVVADAHHVDRGYEDLAGSLSALGAVVERR